MEKTETLDLYDGIYEVPIAKGKRQILVENSGNDWFFVAYTIPWLTAPPPLRAWGLQGRTNGLVWVQNRLHTWAHATQKGYEPQPICGASLQLRDWAEGEWLVTTWDPLAGKGVGARTVVVGEDGILELFLPNIVWDAAFRIAKNDAGGSSSL